MHASLTPFWLRLLRSYENTIILSRVVGYSWNTYHQGVAPFKGSQHQKYFYSDVKTLSILILSQVCSGVFQKLHDVWYCNGLNAKVCVSTLPSSCFLISFRVRELLTWGSSLILELWDKSGAQRNPAFLWTGSSALSSR